MMDGLATPKMPPLTKMLLPCTPWICVIGGDTTDQKRTWLDISRYLLSRYEDDPGDLIERVVIQDEICVHQFDPESKMQSKQWKYPGSPPPKIFKRDHSAEKVMSSIF